MLHEMGIQTGLDISALLAIRADLARYLPNETLYGSLSRPGLPETFAVRSSYALAGHIR